MDSALTPIYHEVGHWMIASALGYKGYITGDIKNNKDYRFIQISQREESKQGLKNQIIIAFGGLGAEKILNIPENIGAIGDLTIACKDLKKLYSLENKVFEFKNYLDFPDNEYNYYLTQSQLVLNQLGGKEKILKLGEETYLQFKQLEVKNE